MFFSIKAKIIIFYIIVLFITLSTLGFFLYFSLTKIVYSSIDRSLLSKAKDLAYLIKNSKNTSNIKFSDESLKKITHNVVWEYDIRKSEDYFQISTSGGTIIKKSRSLKNNTLQFYHENKKISFKTVFFHNKPVRLINFTISHFVIQCAESIDFLKNYRLILFLTVVIIMVISASGGFLIARKALSPIEDISNTINKISESNLSERVKVENIPRELKILASSFNNTFDRLEKFFIRQKEFIANASHELRTPLSIIRSHSEITLRKERSPDEYKNTLGSITKSVEIMTQIVNKLLLLAKIESNTSSLKLENVDLNTIINDSVKLLENDAAQKGIIINIERSNEQQYILQGNRESLRELFVNIIGNAVKYNTYNGRIDINIKKDGEFLAIEIKDTGIGIPEKDIDKVFDRFYRVEKSHSKDIDGLGLGLSIAKQIVDLHKGKIEIKSRLNTGTSVIVYLKKSNSAAIIKP